MDELKHLLYNTFALESRYLYFLYGLGVTLPLYQNQFVATMQETSVVGYDSPIRNSARLQRNFI